MDGNAVYRPLRRIGFPNFRIGDNLLAIRKRMLWPTRREQGGHDLWWLRNPVRPVAAAVSTIGAARA
jgi:hypothetical protein